MTKAILALEDGVWFEGEGFGAEGETFGRRVNEHIFLSAKSIVVPANPNIGIFDAFWDFANGLANTFRAKHHIGFSSRMRLLLTP